jgi:putative transposase
LEEVLWCCRTLYNCALEWRSTWWRRVQGVTASRFQQEAELQEVRTAFPEYEAMHSPVPQDVLGRPGRTYQAFFRRIAAGERAGFPRLQGYHRYHSSPTHEYSNGARLDNGYLVLSKIERIAVRWSRTVEGSIKTITISKDVDGCYVCFSCVDVQVRLLPDTRQESGIDLGNGRLRHPGGCHTH